MINNFRKKLLLSLIFAVIIIPNLAIAQKVGFISSDMIRNKFPEAKQAEQRIQSIVEEWKREIASKQYDIESLEFEIKKNRLIWSDQELAAKEQELQAKVQEKQDYAKQKFESGGEYDHVVEEIMIPIEEKIHAAVAEVSNDEGYDLILDQSIQPIVHANYKYDLTIKVLRKLGVDTDKMEEELDEKIKSDPRNQKRRSKTPRTRQRNVPGQEREREEQKTPNRTFEQNEEEPEVPPHERNPEGMEIEEKEPIRR